MPDNTPIVPLAACGVTPPHCVRDLEIQPRLAICTEIAGTKKSANPAAKTAPLDTKVYDFDSPIRTRRSEASHDTRKRTAVMVLPILPLKNTVLFPQLFMPLSVGRPQSVAAVEAALATEEKAFVVVAQRDASVEQPGLDDLYTVGTRAVVKKSARGEDGVELIVQGVERVAMLKAEQTEPYLKARVRPLPWPEDTGTEVEALQGAVLELAAQALSLVQLPTPIDIRQLAAQAGDPLRLTYLLALDAQPGRGQGAGACWRRQTRVEALRLVHGYLTHEVQVLELRKKISSSVETEMTKQQREHMLRQQMQAIQKELGEKSPEKAEVDELRRRLTEADLPDEVRKEAERELTRLERMPAAAPDFQVTRTYLELVLELPWKKATEDVLDLKKARAGAGRGPLRPGGGEGAHPRRPGGAEAEPEGQGADPLLRRPSRRRQDLAGPVDRPRPGPQVRAAEPGRAARRGGAARPPADLHRRHARPHPPGAAAGRRQQPGADARRGGQARPRLPRRPGQRAAGGARPGPEQHVPRQLPRSAVRSVEGAVHHDGQRAGHDPAAAAGPHGASAPFRLQRRGKGRDRGALPAAAAAGGGGPDGGAADGRAGRRCGASSAATPARPASATWSGRWAASPARWRGSSPRGRPSRCASTPENLKDLLGPERVRPERSRKRLEPGVSTGLAWTEAGGDVLYIEASLLPGVRGGLRLTGQLGDVMRESAKAAQSFVWSHAEALGIDPHVFRHNGVHVHVPAGATPKDGPSAGVAMVAALTSLYTGTALRNDTAMTGEVTLTGLVLPVGGVKEKVLAARRAGMRQVVLAEGQRAGPARPAGRRARGDAVRLRGARRGRAGGGAARRRPPAGGGVG